MDNPHHVEERAVAFSDSDAAGVVHFTALLRYAEDAEHRFLARVGVPLILRENGDIIGWPRVHAQFDFRAPVRFGEEGTVALRLTRVGESSLTFRYRVAQLDTVVAEGEMTAVQACIGPDGPGRSVPLSEDLRARLETILRHGS